MRKLKSLLELRNRLAHFKDNDTVWDASVEFVSKPENWDKAPNPELMEHLSGQKLSVYTSDIDRLLGWLGNVFRIERRRTSASALKSKTC